MPTYEYQCQECNHRLEEIQKFSDPALTKCPKCDKDKLQRLISGGLGFSVKGGTSSSSTPTSRAEAMGGRYIPMDSAEQKFESRMKELRGNGEI